MNDIEVSSIDLVEGGNVFKQGHYLTLGYVPRDEKGDTVDLSGKTLNVALWSRKGVAFEAAATFSGGVIRFTLDKVVAAGDYTVEFTATSSTDGKYRKKFPTNQHSGRIAIKQSADDLGVVGIQVYTVAQLKAEQKALLDAAVSGFTVDSETKMARVSGTTTHPTIGARLEADKQATAQQLEDKVAKGQVTVFDINKNLGKLDQTYMTDDFLKQIAGTASINATVANYSLPLHKTTISKIVSNNIFNPATAKSGFIVLDTTGAEVATAGFWVSDFMKITTGQQYSKPGGYRYAFYNSAKVFISGGQGALMTAPLNAVYLKVCFTDIQITGNTAQVNLGATLKAWDQYKEIIDKQYVETPLLSEKDIPLLPANKLSFMRRSSNLYNKRNVELGKYVWGDTGEIVVGDGFALSGWEAVEGNLQIIIKTMRHIAFYDEKKTFISGIRGSVVSNKVITTPANAKYFRFSWFPSSDVTTIDDQQVNIGNALGVFEVGGYTIPSEYIEGESNVQPTKDAKAILPPRIHAIVGQEINIYFENTLNVPLKDVTIDVECDIGKQVDGIWTSKHQEKRWTVIPDAVGTFAITISVYKDYELVNQAISSIIVKSAGVGGANRNAIIIGDSTINNQYMINALMTKLESDPLNLTLYGTRGSGASKHEGRGGWTAAKYRTGEAYSGVPNPFYNGTDFSFQHYMENQNYPTLDYAGLCLGINETFGLASDNAVLAEIPRILAHFDHIINSIKSYNANIKIGVFVTIPPSSSQDIFGAYRGTGQTQWRYKRNNALWIEALINHYKNVSGVYLIPDNSNIDADAGFTDHVHPNSTIGDVQRADTLFYWLKSFEV